MLRISVLRSLDLHDFFDYGRGGAKKILKHFEIIDLMQAVGMMPRLRFVRVLSVHEKVNSGQIVRK